MTTDTRARIFDPRELLPAEWAGLSDGAPLRAFNPGLLQESDGWLFAARIVGADGARRISICRLDRNLRVIADSQVPFSDAVRFRLDANAPREASTWFADPRLYRLRGRIFLSWNSGWHEPRNYQFLQELDGATLRPAGAARELVLRGPRQKLEKNWTLFAGQNGGVFAIYSITPHVVLQFTLEGEGDIVLEEVARASWWPDAYPRSHGGLRGGAPPCVVGDCFWSICHSVHDAPEGYRYAAAAYAFSAGAGFPVLRGPIRPLDLWNPSGGRRVYEKLNPAVGQVIYPCGAVHDGARWWISYGINDEQCAVSCLEHTAVLATTEKAGAQRVVP